jgi:uncharacterized protein YggE
MRRSTFVVLVTCLAAGPLAAQDFPIDPRNPLITASGKGEISRPADYVEVEVGLQSRGSSPGGAAGEIDRLLSVVRDSLRARRIPDSALVVGTRAIIPAQNYTDRNITGYAASLSFSVKLRELAALPQLLDALAGAGATQVSQVSYRSDHEDAEYAEAVAEAVASAKRDAEATARAAGGRLGAIVYVDATRMDQRYVGHHVYLPGMNTQARGAEAVSAAAVTIYWRFEGRP